MERIYGVSSGNGNDGVSHMFADYYVKTSEPYRLATLAMVSQFKDEFQGAVLDAVNVDGEAEYTIAATIYEPLDFEPEEEGDSWCGANGAAHIIEVFPEDEPRDGVMVYDGLLGAFGEKLLEQIKE